MKAIPFSPFPLKTLLSLGERIPGIGYNIAITFPKLGLELRQAEIDIDPKHYGGIIFVLSAFYFFAMSLIAFLFATRLAPKIALLIAPIVGILAAGLIFAQLAVYPKIQVKKKVRDIDLHLVFALRTVLVEIKSGVSLFDSMNTIADGNYGEISKEFKKTIEKINTGGIEENVLDDMATNNPSLFFRRAIWQLVNGLKSGSDISTVISSLVDSLIKEQRNQVKLYGAALKLLSLVYMMLGVIVPALGLTLLIILSTFPQIKIAEIYFWVMLLMLLAAQFMYIGMLKSKRPNLLGD